MVRACLRKWYARIREWNIEKFNDFYSSLIVFPYFNACARDGSRVYYSTQDIANALFDLTSDNDGTIIKKFLADIRNICDEKIPKLNSSCVISAEKNVFCDAIAAFLQNYGIIGTGNKTNNFTRADMEQVKDSFRGTNQIMKRNM